MKVIGDGTTQQITYNFVFVFYPLYYICFYLATNEQYKTNATRHSNKRTTVRLFVSDCVLRCLFCNGNGI